MSRAKLSIFTPILLNGYIDWVRPWRVVLGEPVYMYGEDFDSPYCPVDFEVENDAI